MYDINEIKSVQASIDNGSVWRMEGSSGRYAMELINSGYCVLGEKGFSNYYGNYVPSRTEVDKGTKGSIEYAKRINPDFVLLTQVN